MISKTFKTVAILTCILTYSCTNESSWFKLFSFPPDSEPHENNWEYFGSIYFYYNGKLDDISEKRGSIRIENKAEMVLLKDTFKITGGNVNAEILWYVFDTLTILLYDEDVGKPIIIFNDSTANSTYTNYLMRLDYCFDSSRVVFDRCFK